MWQTTTSKAEEPRHRFLIHKRNGKAATPAVRTVTGRPLNSDGSHPLPESSAMQVLTVLNDGGEHARQQPILLGTTENALGLREFCEKRNIDLVVTSDKEGPDSVFAKEVVDTDVLNTTPFHPADGLLF
ncbi:hypothetical protein JCM10213_008173 [Rhodosporidiobolus nylandii]